MVSLLVGTSLYRSYTHMHEHVPVHTYADIQKRVSFEITAKHMMTTSLIILNPIPKPNIHPKAVSNANSTQGH